MNDINELYHVKYLTDEDTKQCAKDDCCIHGQYTIQFMYRKII